MTLIQTINEKGVLEEVGGSGWRLVGRWGWQLGCEQEPMRIPHDFWEFL